MGGGHAGGHHHEHAQPAVLGLVEHVADAVQAEHVGDLVRIGDHRGDAFGHHRRGKLPHTDHRTLDVDVRVDQAGGQVAAFQVNFAYSLVAGADAGDPRALDRHVSGVDLAGIHVDEPGIAQHQISRRVSARHAHQVIEFHRYPPAPYKPEAQSRSWRHDITPLPVSSFQQSSFRYGLADYITSTKQVRGMTRVICRPHDFGVIFTVLLHPFTLPLGRSFPCVHYLKGGETARQNSPVLLLFA